MSVSDKILKYLTKALHFDVFYKQQPAIYGGYPSDIDIKKVDLSLNKIPETEFIKTLKKLLEGE